MSLIVVQEYGRFERAQLGKALERRLHRFDDQHAKTIGDHVFDWRFEKYIRVKSYVGVLQIPGLTIEILPKIDDAPIGEGPIGEGSETAMSSRRNLLYMLSLTKKIEVKERDLANLRLQKMPVLEALSAIFARRLLEELRKGLDRGYVNRQENLSCVKGKILIGEHLKRNAGHDERVYVSFEVFASDTMLNAILKAACRRLLGMVRKIDTQQKLREAMLRLCDVADVEIESHHFESIILNRNNGRFGPLLTFCRMVLTRLAPAPGIGKHQTFSLLFPMPVLFEEFIANFIWRYAEEIGIDRRRIHIQARRKRKPLLREGSKPKFVLKPDILIEPRGDHPRIVIDTKWKRLDRSAGNQNVSQADVYQLYAYAQRYDSPQNILLYPKASNSSAVDYVVDKDGDSPERHIRVELVDLSYDVRRERGKLVNDLQRILVLDCSSLACQWYE